MNLDIKMVVQRIAIGCLLAGSVVWASAQDATPAPAPDNTKVNIVDGQRRWIGFCESLPGRRTGNLS